MYVSVFVSGISSSLHRKPLQSRKTFTDIWFWDRFDSASVSTGNLRGTDIWQIIPKYVNGA